MREDPSIKLFMAARVGNTDDVKRLIPIADATTQNNRGLRHAVSYGHTDCVKLLLPVSNLNDDIGYDHLIEKAIETNHLACVQILLSAQNLPFDPHLSITHFLWRAVSWEKSDIVRFLIPLTLTKIATDERYTYKILQTSILKGNEDIFNQLLVFSNPQLAWDELHKQGHSAEECFLVVEHLARLQQHHNISSAIETKGAISSSRKL